MKIMLRCGMPFFVLAALGGHMADGLFGASQVWTAPRAEMLGESPDGRYRALLYHFNDPFASKDSRGTVLVLQHHFHRFSLGELTALSTDQQVNVSLRWTTQHTLLIQCKDCDREQTTLSPRNWGKLHLAYDLP